MKAFWGKYGSHHGVKINVMLGEWKLDTGGQG